MDELILRTRYPLVPQKTGCSLTEFSETFVLTSRRLIQKRSIRSIQQM
ncbi:MAG: hypothetical protein IJ225_08225 [Solobacterium sp.]|nr:hypothetical protein [Solobacterium sp.]